MFNKEVERTIYKKVRSSGTSGIIIVPKNLIGKEVKIIFLKELTDLELKEIELIKLRKDLEELRKTLKIQKVYKV